MNIVCFDLHLATTLQDMGHQVYNFTLQPGITEIKAFLDTKNIVPDCIIQQEKLGDRVFLDGIAEMDCPTMFIAIDSHLNMDWQRYYAKLFDLVMSPHISIFEALPNAWAIPDVKRFAPIGQSWAWTPHKERKNKISMCARVTTHRPVRMWMTNLLKEKYAMHIESELPYWEMMKLYADTCVIPNDSIAWEVNFRLFEGASAGAMVISPDIGEDQNTVFEPDKEIVIYRNAVELLEKIRFYGKHPDTAEKIGFAAWERVNKEHLPKHRAAMIIDLFKELGGTKRRAEAQESHFYTLMTHISLARRGGKPFTAAGFNHEINTLSKIMPERDAFLTAQAILVSTEATRLGTALYAEDNLALKQTALGLCKKLMAISIPGDDLLVAISMASAAAIILGDLPLARSLWKKYSLTISPETQPDAIPKTPYQLCLNWAKIMSENGFMHQMGLAFLPGDMIPLCSYEWLLMAQSIAPADNKEWLLKQSELCRNIQGYTFYFYGLLAQRCVFEPTNWRVQLEYGLSSLKVCRLEEGLYEISEAREKALTENKITLFNNMLAAAAAGNYIVKVLH